MGFRTDWLWILPPESTTEEVDRLIRQLRRMNRWQRFKDRLRYGPWT